MKRIPGACGLPMWCLAWSAWLVALTGSSFCRAECDSITTFEDGLTPTAEQHVAVGGNDDTGDGTPANPYATIGFAAAQAIPGTAVIVHSGTYAGGNYVSDLAGTAEAPIWIGGAAGEDRPIIDGGSEGLHLVRARYVIVHDLEVRNAIDNGINSDDGGEYANPLASHHLIFRDLYIHDIGGGGNQDGLKLSGINDYFVLDCEITNCGGSGSGSGIDQVGCHQGLIARCYFHDLSGNAIQCKGGSEDIEIRWNHLHEAGERGVNIGGSTGFAYFRPPLSTIEPNFEARDIRVLANVIEGGTASIAFVGCVESVVASNTIVDPHNWIIRILQETTSSGDYEFLPCADNVFESNLVYFDRSDLSIHVNIGSDTEPETFIFANNLWYAHNNPAHSTPNLPADETDGIYGEDPLLTDPANGDYRILADSPAAGSGLGPALIEGDFRGVCYRSPPSIGVYEIPPTGDANCDGVINLFDIDPFVLAVADADAYAQAYPDCDHMLADANGDGSVNNFDIDPFVALLIGG